MGRPEPFELGPAVPNGYPRVDLQPSRPSKDSPSGSSSPSKACNRALAAATAVIVARYGDTAGAVESEVRLLLSYSTEEDVAGFFRFLEKITRRYGEAADLTLEEARGLARTPKNVRERGQVIEEYLDFVVSTVAQFSECSGATAREVKAISRYMQQQEIVEYYDLVQRLSMRYDRSIAEIKTMLSTKGQKETERELSSSTGKKPSAPWWQNLGDPNISSAEKRHALETLGFEAGAKPGPVEIASRYRQLARKWHPDKWSLQGEQSVAVATDVTKSLVLAYEWMNKNLPPDDLRVSCEDADEEAEVYEFASWVGIAFEGMFEVYKERKGVTRGK